MFKTGSDTQSGKSLMELMVVLAIVIVIVTMAVPQLGTAGSNLDRQNIAREFKVSLERARFDSVKRRATDCEHMSRVVIYNATSFTLFNDLNQNGTIETSSEARTVDFANRSDVIIVGDDVSFPVTFRFDRRGNVTTGSCAAPVNQAARVVFCNEPCTAGSATASNSNVVFVSRTGTAAMMTGGSSLPTFSNPTVTNVNSNSQVNPLLAVWDEASSPTPWPTPEPTATVDPGTTPTPSATACVYGERPDQTGCTCVSPMWQRSNGRCQ